MGLAKNMNVDAPQQCRQVGHAGSGLPMGVKKSQSGSGGEHMPRGVAARTGECKGLERAYVGVSQVTGGGSDPWGRGPPGRRTVFPSPPTVAPLPLLRGAAQGRQGSLGPGSLLDEPVPLLQCLGPKGAPEGGACRSGHGLPARLGRWQGPGARRRGDIVTALKGTQRVRRAPLQPVPLGIEALVGDAGGSPDLWGPQLHLERRLCEGRC
mmetsp:Transcript_104396/g.179894  ORF Transcript_104396/g.179894 Transcript_104396/m.179894 type:complete len:210 (-) Transcript_104396:535-1164(-)